MAVQKEIWLNYITMRLYKDNAFLNFLRSHDEYVLGGKIVHIPQPGTRPTVVKNRAIFPGVAVRRTDTDITYTLDGYSTDPTSIPEADQAEISYDKLSSVYGDHVGYLVETVSDDIVIKLLTGLPATAIVNTTGADTAAYIPGQTGTRKALVTKDLKTAALKMNLQNIPQNDRVALVESNMLDQLVSDLSATQYRDFSQYFDAANNVVGKLHGFNIIDRSNVGLLSAANVVNALGAVVAATDNATSLLWQKDQAARAVGEMKFFQDLDSPLYYGDVYSALLRAGASRLRGDNAGVIALVAGAV